MEHQPFNNNKEEEDSRHEMSTDDSHHEQHHSHDDRRGRLLPRNASRGDSSTIPPPFATSLLTTTTTTTTTTNNNSGSILLNNNNNEAASISSATTGLSFPSAGIAGTGMRGLLFEPIHRSLSATHRDSPPEEEKELLRQQSIMHVLAGRSPLSSLSLSTSSPSSSAAAIIDNNNNNNNNHMMMMNIGKRWTIMTLALERLQQALNMIPTNEKLDYLAALQVAPDLVLKESNPSSFLRCTNYDAVAAARKLVFYWKSRRSIFGDRAYRPMTLTGDGALSAEDIAHVHSGYIAYAPPDQEGCTVAVYDGSRRTSELALVRKRGIFYHGQYFSENPHSHTAGFVILCIVNAPKYDSLTAEGIYMLTSIFPLKLKAWHILDCMSDQQNPKLAQFAEGYLLGFMESFLHRFNKSTIYFHSPADSKDTLWELVTEHGVSLDAIPDFLGGTWTYERFDEWWIQRLAVERGLFFFHPTGEPMAYEQRRRIDSSRSHKRSKRSTTSTSTSTEEETIISSSDDDSNQYHAKYSSTTTNNNNDKQRNSMEELLEQFQNLVFSGSGGANTGTTKPDHDDNDDDEMHESIPEHPNNSSNSPDAAAMMQLEALHKALEAISVLEKVDFLTALHVVPHLVLQESEPARFLAFYGWNPDQAAQGMVDYWKQRHDLFGDRAFLPMTMTGDGALNANDIAFYKCGSLVMTGKDRNGNWVLVLDASRRTTTEDTGVLMRTAFYTWQVLFENHTSEFVLIQIIRGPDYDKAVTEAIQMVLRVFPIKAKALHTFDLMYSVDLFRRGFVQALIGVAFNLYSTAKTFFHSPERNNLQNEHGLSQEVLPCSIGGTWSYERFEEWQVQRINFEREMHSTTLIIPTDPPVSERPPLESEQVTNTKATGGDHSSDAMHYEQKLISSDDVVKVNAPACTTSAQVPSNEKTNQYLSMLDNEIRNLFPRHRTRAAAYWEARQTAPFEIWKDECNPELFLRVEDWNVQKAAERLVRYWQLRSQICGKRRYDRLTQTGDEVLGRHELPVLNTGFLTLLPVDSKGRSVLCIDPDRLDHTMAKDARDRCIFYMMSLLTENDLSQTDGVVWIHKLSSPKFTFVNVPLFEQIAMAMPLRLHAIHLVCREDVPADVVKSLEPFHTNVHVHASNSKEVLLSELEQFGMMKANLPKFVNGEWGYEKFVQWQEYRTRMEWGIPLGWSGCTDISNFPAIRFYALLEKGDVAERKRRMDLIHFRRKQNRDRVTIAILKERSADLQDEQTQLRLENQELEAKHAAAILLGLPRD